MSQVAHTPRSSFVARAKARLAACLPSTPLSWMAWTAVPLVLGASFMAISAGTAPDYPPVNLAAEPLYASVTTDKPTIALALSVEFPTVGAQYVQTPGSKDDSAYSTDKEYLGYYDAEACYIYNNSPTEPDPKRFDRSDSTTNRKCTGEKFSGNFLNWVSSSAVDMLRLALSGGDRYIDTPTLTILQRAVLPDSSVSTNFWNGTNFPSKNLLRAGKDGANDFWGAIPESMRTTAGNNNISIANDKNKIYFRAGTKQGTTVSSATNYTLGSIGTIKVNTDGFFYARIQVCNTDSSGELADKRDYQLCKQYPAGNYKPIGAIQKYSNQLRLAAFGYMPQSKNNSANGATFGGVLRAPMKYVGIKTYDINGQDNTPSGGNPNTEWNINNGVFLKDPDSGELGNSGVINYLNKFGRTGTTQGLYKYYDPLGELYYETLRYLQGLQPTPTAIANITSAMKDGFPVYTTWSDPYGGGRTPISDYSCLKSNIVVIGDVNIDSSGSSRYPSTSAANNVPNITGWLNTVNDFERGAGSNYVDGQGVTRSTSNPNISNGNMPSDKMIGLAYWAHTHDIRGTNWTDEGGTNGKQRPGLRVKTFSFDVNEFGEQIPDNVRRNQNELFMTAKYGGFQSDPSNSEKDPYNTFGNPFKRQDGTNDNNVWRDPLKLGPNGTSGGIGEAKTYYLQSDARGVLSAFDEIFSRASSGSRSIAGGASSSSSVSSSTAIYSGRFDTSNWSGDVVAEPITANATNFELSFGTPLWSAANMLDTRPFPATTRNIVVGRESAVASPAATNFTWAAIDAALQEYLNKASPTSGADSLGSNRLSYIRGDRTQEGSPFRVRSSLLGDIINSSVVYSGAPGKGFTGTGYTAFATTYASRTPAVFAGANDGMLHAFNANTGAELFGFIPSWLGPKLSALSDPTFATSHQSYVDAPLAVGEAQVASTNTASAWKTVLVAGTGGGGSGVFALDVSDPAAFDASKVMWEFKRTDDADIGQVIGQPRIMKFKTSGSASTATYRWFAVVASGVNNYVTDAAGNFSATGKPALFLLALDKPVGTSWAEGTNYYKISIPVDATLTATTAPGLVNFNALYGANGEVTDIYMGDMHGKLWKLSFGQLASTDWNMDKLSYFNKGTAASPIPYPMFIAKSGSTVQPITAPPTLFTGPVVGGMETFYVTFGTGKYLETADNTSTLTNSFYALYDNGSSAGDASPVGEAAISGRGRLMAGTANASTKVITVPSFKWGRPTAAEASAGSSRAGWYFDMPVTGEKLVSHILDVGPRTGSFNTVIPGASGAAASSCSNAPGSGNQYIINMLDGTGRYVVSTVGIPGPPIFFINPTSDDITDTKSDSTGRRIRTTVKRGVTLGQSGVSRGVVESVKETVGRLTWRQIHNYQDQKNAP